MDSWVIIYIEHILKNAELVKDNSYAFGWSIYLISIHD